MIHLCHCEVFRFKPPPFLSVIMTGIISIKPTAFEHFTAICGSHIMNRMMMIMMVRRINDTPHSTVMPKAACQLDL